MIEFTVEFEDLARRMFIRDEGRTDRVIDDATGRLVKAPLGKLTLGIGHNIEAKPLPAAVIELLFRFDLADAYSEARRVIGEKIFDSLSTNRKLAMVNLAFNLGEAGLAQFKKMLAALRVRDYQWAGAHLRDSLWANQVDPKHRPNEGRDDRVIRLIVEDYYDY